MAYQPPHKATAFFLDQSTLACKAGCGFFGNPEWFGYCSICFKQLNTNQYHPPMLPPMQHPSPSAPPRRHQQQQQSPSSAQPSSPTSTTSTIIPSPITGSSVQMSQSEQHQQQQQQQQQLLLTQQLQSWWHHKMPEQPFQLVTSSQPEQSCIRDTNKFAKELLQAEKKTDKSINDLSDMVHEFYQTMNNKFENHLTYKSCSPEQIEELSDTMERILNENIYHIISGRIINEDEEHIMAVQKRIRSLNWITVEHLEIDIDFQHPVVHDLLDKAICQLIEMNSRTSSLGKLDCIVGCSKTIFELILVKRPGSDGGSAHVSADHFLPVLVFVVIQANPPMLPADMKYLSRFSNPRRLMSGETGYYFTNLCCAIEFIEKASGASLNISEEEFKKYVNGEAVPVTKSQFNTYLCDGLRIMCSNEAALDNLKRRHEERETKMNGLQEQIDVHLETNRAKLKEMQAFAASLKAKLTFNLPKLYSDILARNKEYALKLIPSYLKPIINACPNLEARLVDIEPETSKPPLEQQHTTTIAPHSLDSKSPETKDNEQAPSLSPVEQLESDLGSLKLPDPIQPESITSDEKGQ